MLCFCCDVKGFFCQFPVTVRRKAHNGWTSIKGGQIDSTTIITIDSFLRGHSRLPVLLTELSVGCLNIKARVLNAREVERQRERGRKKNEPCCHLTTCYRSATAAGLALLDERGGSGGTAARNLFRSINAMFIFEALAWCAPLLFQTKWWVCEAGRNGDRLGWAFLAQRM